MALQKNSKKKQIRLGYANPVSTLRVNASIKSSLTLMKKNLENS